MNDWVLRNGVMPRFDMLPWYKELGSESFPMKRMVHTKRAWSSLWAGEYHP